MNYSDMINVFKNGTYYNPANKRYKQGSSVICDRCYRKDLQVAIGLNDCDLCMRCIQDISEELGKKRGRVRPLRSIDSMWPPPATQHQYPPSHYSEPEDKEELMTLMAQSQYQYSGMATNMMQNQFSVTRMEQGIFDRYK